MKSTTSLRLGKDHDFWRQRLTLVPLLTALHKALCLAWAHQHRHHTVNDWKHVTSSDECHFQLNRADGRVRVWRQSHESLDPTYEQGTVQAGGSVMVWSMCSWRDMRPLTRVDTTLTGDGYVCILFDHLRPFMYIVHSDGLGEFQQDTATLPPTHTRPELLQSGSRSTLLNLGTCAGHQNHQI
ncbi:transposable element Tcb2 transposase [Trichonephila clavipes]|nr:transposable element Tcb2 transposase [Trichonephila clavipes]